MDGRRRDDAQRPGRRRADGRGEEARGQRDASDQPGRALRARPGGDPGHLSPRSPHAADEAHRRLAAPASSSRSPGTRRSRSWSASSTRSRLRAIRRRWRSSPRPHRGQRAALARRVPARVRRAARRSPSSCSRDDVLRRANAISFGREQLPTFDLAQRALRDQLRRRLPRHLELAGRAQRGATAAMRQGRPGVRGAFVQVESRMSLTGASADEWVPAKPGTEGVLALGLAHVILAEKLRPADAGRAGALIDGWSAGLTDYTPDAGRDRSPASPAKRIERLAREFAERGPRSRSSAARRWRTPTACSPRSPSTRSTSCSARRPAGRPVLHAAAVASRRARPGVGHAGADSRRRARRRCCCSTARTRCSARRRRGRCARRFEQVPFIASASAASSTTPACWPI